MVWQLSAVVWELYTDERIGGLRYEKRDVIQNRLTEIRKEITSKKFLTLPLSKFKEVFNLDLDNLQKNKNRVRLKSLFS